MARAQTVIPNPFVITNEWDDVINILQIIDRYDIRVEDTLIGCARAFKAEVQQKEGRIQEYVSWSKLYKMYSNMNEITRPKVQEYLGCSESTAKRYIQVAKLATPFLTKLVEGKDGINIVGYPDIRYFFTTKHGKRQ